MTTCFIYSIINVVSNKRYVGSSISLKSRLKKHFSNLRKGKHCNEKLQRAFDKYGEWAFETETLATCAASERAEVESLWIERLNAVDQGYNICRNGMSTLSTPQSPEHIARRVASKKGYRHSDETRAKIAMSKRGTSAEHLHTPEVRAKAGAKLRGKHLSAEHRATLSAAAKCHQPPSQESLLRRSESMKRARQIKYWGPK